MDEVYHGRLSAHPHAPTEPDIPIPQPQPYQQNPPDPQPIPIQLPNIYVHPYPNFATPPGPSRSAQQPNNIPTIAPPPSTKMKVGPFSFTKPHPLLLVSLVLSVIALVLGVPKGTLPTLTGRHKQLRAREQMVAEKLHLISHLSHFLPPPLANLIQVDPEFSKMWSSKDLHRFPIGLRSHSGLKFWSGGQVRHGGGTPSGGDEGRWWSVEELGEGASVVRSSREGCGGGKEVWVLKMGETEDPNRPLLSALTHSLLLRDKLQQDLDDARSHSIPTPQHAQVQLSGPPLLPTTAPSAPLALGNGPAEGREEQQEAIKDKWERLEVRKRRDKEREREVEDRERAVGDREKWVIEEMNSHATELTLEDRITERLKSYQRQLAQLHAEPQSEGSPPRSRTEGIKDF